MSSISSSLAISATFCVDLGLRQPRRLQREGDVFAHGQRRIERIALEGHGDVALDRRQRCTCACRRARSCRATPPRSRRSCAASRSCRSPTSRAARRSRPSGSPSSELLDGVHAVVDRTVELVDALMARAAWSCRFSALHADDLAARRCARRWRGRTAARSWHRPRYGPLPATGPGVPAGRDTRISRPRTVRTSVTVFSFSGVSASTVTGIAAGASRVDEGQRLGPQPDARSRGRRPARTRPARCTWTFDRPTIHATRIASTA